MYIILCYDYQGKRSLTGGDHAKPGAVVCQERQPGSSCVSADASSVRSCIRALRELCRKRHTVRVKGMRGLDVGTTLAEARCLAARERVPAFTNSKYTLSYIL